MENEKEKTGFLSLPEAVGEKEPPIGRGRPKGSLDTYKRKRRTDRSCNASSEYVSNLCQFQIELAKAPKLKERPEEDEEERLWNCFMGYMELCAKYGIKPGVEGFCAYAGISRFTFYNWEAGRNKNLQDITGRIKTILAAGLEAEVNDGKINTVAGIFYFKNHFGYTDKNEVILTPNNNDKEGLTAEQLEKKYADAAYIDEPTEDKTVSLADKYADKGE